MQWQTTSESTQTALPVRSSAGTGPGSTLDPTGTGSEYFLNENEENRKICRTRREYFSAFWLTYLTCNAFEFIFILRLFLSAFYVVFMFA